MSLRLRRLRPALVAALLLIIGIVSCGREVTGPGGRGVVATISFNPVFGSVRLEGTGEVLSIGSVVDFDRVRVVLLRANGDTAVDRMVPFPPESTTVRLSVSVPLSEEATSQGEPLAATLKYLNAIGDTVFSGGPIQIVARPSSNPGPAPDVPLDYTGPGANAASIVIAPDSFTGTIGQGNTFTAVVRDSANSILLSAPVAFTSTDSARVRVNLRSGVTNLVGARGSAIIIAQTLTGQADSAVVNITPTASAVVLVSGGNQQVRAGEVFPAPIRIRVNAVDGLGVSGVPVDFAVTQGGGSVTPLSAVTDANGEAVATWTAGATAGAAVLRASIAGNTIGVNVNGNQLSAAATSLQFTASPANFTAGDTIPPFNVLVLDATGDTVAGFGGTVTLGLTGGTGTANLVGTVARAAVNGVASFSGLTIDRAGTGFRLVAAVTGVPSAQSATFNVAAAPPRFVTVIAGGGQTAPASTVLPDSVRVRVTDAFGLPVPGVNVTFTVTSGGGSLAPTARVTDASGTAATSWTLGASGAQQISAAVAGLNPLPITASIFVPNGNPTLFVGTGSVSTTVGGSRSIPIFVNPAATSPVVAQLVVRDTLIADWLVDSVVFSVGATLRSPSVIGRGRGSTYAVVTSAIGTDSLLVTVDSASVTLRSFQFRTTSIGDTLRTNVRLSEPAPPGGLTAVVRSADPTKVLIAPWSGLGIPDEACGYYCGGFRAADGPSILAPPADSALIVIPEGQVYGHVAVFPIDSTIAVDLLVNAPGYAGSAVQLEIRRPVINYFPSWTLAVGTPSPVGSREELFVSVNPTVNFNRVARFTARNPSSVLVDSIGLIGRGEFDSEIGYTILAPDSSYVLVEIPGMPADSFLVRGVPAFTRISLENSTLIPDSRVQFIAGVVADTLVGAYFGQTAPRAADMPLTVISRTPSVARIDVGSAVLTQGNAQTQLSVRAVGAGTSWIVVQAPGAGADSALVTVAPSALTLVTNGPSLGVGQVHQSMWVSTSANFGAYLPTAPVTITSSDTSVLMVATPQVPLHLAENIGQIRLVGRAVGTSVVSITVPGYTTVTATFTVTQPRLLLATFALATTLNADSANFGLNTLLRDATTNFNRATADTVIASVRSTDPSVLQVTDSVIRFFNASSTFTGSVRPIGPGTAQLIVSAPGHIGDTSAVVTVRAPRVEISATSISTGIGLRTPITVARRALPGLLIPLTVTVQGPAGVTAVGADTLLPNATSRTIFVNSGTIVGTDTVIVGGVGVGSDTVVLNVGASRVQPLTTTVTLVGEESEVGVQMRPVAAFSANTTSDTTRFTLTLRDTSVFALVSDSVKVAPGNANPIHFGRVRARRPGQSWLVASDPLGRFNADSVLILARAQQLTGSFDDISLAMREETDPFEMYVYREFYSDDSLWVRLVSSAPALVSVPDSVLIPPGSSYEYFQIATGDTVGGAMITASAPGFLPYRWYVNVARGELVPYSNGGQLRIGGSERIGVYTRAADTFDSHAPLDTIPVRLRSSNPGVMTIGADSLVLLTASNVNTESFGPLIGTGNGWAILDVEDTRVGNFRRLLGTRPRVDVTPPRILTDQAVVAVTPGLRSDFAGYVFTGSTGDSTTITPTVLGGRVAVTPGTLEYNGRLSSQTYFDLTGISAGLDTVVFTAPGFLSDTIEVVLANGSLRTNVPAPVRFDENTTVTLQLNFWDASNSFARVGPNALPVTFTSQGQLSARSAVDGTPLGTVNVPAGSNSFNFQLRSLTAGNGLVTISAPNMSPLVVRVQVVPNPN